MLTENQKHHINIRELGCIVCRNEGLAPNTPAELRFIDVRREGRRHATSKECYPLCRVHLYMGDGSPRYQGQVAVRKNLHVFESRYGTERQLMQQALFELTLI